MSATDSHSSRPHACSTSASHSRPFKASATRSAVDKVPSQQPRIILPHVSWSNMRGAPLTDPSPFGNIAYSAIRHFDWDLEGRVRPIWFLFPSPGSWDRHISTLARASCACHLWAC